MATLIASFVVLLIAVLSSTPPAAGKVFERCELARELLYKHKLPASQVATWVCIARYESEYNTTAVGHAGGDGSGDHGLFQISDLYWCSRSKQGRACGLHCRQLEDDDITDDVDCAKKIYREHKGLSGNGFNAWAVYSIYCRNPDKFVRNCFDYGLEGGNELGDAYFGVRPQVEEKRTGSPFSRYGVSTSRYGVSTSRYGVSTSRYGLSTSTSPPVRRRIFWWGFSHFQHH